MPDGQPTAINAPAEVLNRQIHPTLLHPVQTIMSTAFTPSDGDVGLLSTLRGTVDPAEAHRRWTAKAEQESAGTWGIKVGDALALNLSCVDDSCLPDSPPDHASVDFNGAPSKGAKRQLGRKLRNASVSAGPLYIA